MDLQRRATDLLCGLRAAKKRKRVSLVRIGMTALLQLISKYQSTASLKIDLPRDTLQAFSDKNALRST